MTCHLGRWRRVKEAVWLLVALATVSMIISLHLGDQLSWFRSSPSDVKMTKVSDNDVIPQVIEKTNNNDNNGDVSAAENVTNFFSKEVVGTGHQYSGTISAFNISSLLIMGSDDENNSQFLEKTIRPLSFTDLKSILKQIESSITPPAGDILVKGTLTSLNHHFSLIKAAFHKYNVMLDDSVAREDNKVKSENWSILMCTNTTQDTDGCVVSALKPFQKVNVMPDMLEVLTHPQQMCFSEEKEITPGQWLSGDLRCYTSQHPDLLACDNLTGWLEIGSENFTGKFISCPEVDHSASLISKQMVLIKLPQKPLMLNGLLLIWQAEVLVTSLWPLRAYLHPNGLLWDNLDNYYNKKHQKKFSLSDMRLLIAELKNEEMAELMIDEIHSAITETFIFFSHSKTSKKDISSCLRCFQVFNVILMFNASYHPFVLQVTPYSYSHELLALSDYLLEQNILEDLPLMLLSREQISLQVATILSTLKILYLTQGQLCNQVNNLCLKQEDLIYLLDTRKEQRALKSWKRLYPTSFIRKTHALKAAPSDSALENLALVMEQYFLGNSDTFENILVKDGTVVSLKSDSIKDHLTSFSSIESSLHFYERNCKNETSSQPYLNAVYTRPPIQLYPEFSPLNTEYLAFVDYFTTVIEIIGVPMFCSGLVRLEDREENNVFNNFTLGIGLNTAHLLVMEMSRGGLYVLNTYKIIINRPSSNQLMGIFHGGQTHQVCYLRQHCSLPMIPTESCGLRASHFDSWSQFVQHVFSLSQCGSKSQSSGQWIVPCLNCNDSNSCHWENATWHQPDCKEIYLSRHELKKCLNQKRVLFIGDSTNRGILHYMIYRLNGSLVEWDKTHNIRIFNLNQGNTIFAFAYYPQFWLAPKLRPLLEKALSQLFKRTPLHFDPVIVLGGVQWLLRRHLDILSDFLSSMKLTNSKVVVKGLGSGFHQSVSGIHQLSKEAHYRLQAHNQVVLSYARNKGFSVVDTFGMTMSRFTDFLPGKCACHFHKVVPVKQSIINKMFNQGSSKKESETQYTVEGEINTIYSEMVINRICSL